jgi:hypothetical protein
MLALRIFFKLIATRRAYYQISAINLITVL